MLEECKSLKYLNFSNLNTTKVGSMWCMFCGSSIKFLDLNNFDTSSVISMNQMFMNCKSLISLNINNFKISLVENMNGMFINCTSLISLNLFNFNFKQNVDISNIFSGKNKNLIYCINKNKFPSSLDDINMKCSDDCFKNSINKFILEENKCIDNCKNHNIYKYEYNNICY